MKCLKLEIIIFSFILFPAIVKSLEEQRECRSDEYFSYEKSKCLKGCQSDESCKENEICNDSTRECEIGCRGHYQCLSNEYCNDITSKCKIGCHDDIKCDADKYCDFGECKTGCRDDDSCESGKYCNEKTKICTKGCRSDDDCGLKEYCNFETRLCTLGCSSHFRCDETEYCDYTEHKCVDACFQSACGNNSKCTSFGHNQYCSCQEGYFPERGSGCRLKIESENYSSQDCSLYCSRYGKCDFKDGTVYCFCPLVIRSFLNPFIVCDNSKFRISLGTTKALIYG